MKSLPSYVTALAILGGIAGGVAVSVGVALLRAPASNARSATTGTAAARPPSSAELAAIHRRLSRAEQLLAHPAADTESGDADDRDLNDSPIVRSRNRHAEGLEQHARSQIDPEWADVTAAKVKESLQTVEERGAIDIRAIDCRSNSCVATVQWPNYQAAATTYSDIMGSPFVESCGVSVLLNTPDDTVREYETFVLYRCLR